MKTKIFLLAVLILPIVAMGQINQKNLSESSVTPPVFTGIHFLNLEADSYDQLLDIYLAENFQYPESAIDHCQQGTGIVRFTVMPNGELSDFQIINSVCPVLDEAFIEVLKSTSGEWQPALNSETPIKMEKEVAMSFFIDREWIDDPMEYFEKVAQRNFSKGSKLFLVKGKAERALKYYNESVKYLPNDASSLFLRGLCEYELGDEEAARHDWERLREIGIYDPEPFTQNLTELKGWDVMKQIVGLN